ncbi:hypothetical protein A0H76_2928 [Hepatospora eriocheir]|uniref:Uncharacterized protein n=1 Tax=Hepatospora eriocheir TaxID=1081669 RepID=A0A1X0Q5I3_9MICR|nr:hypothetical protein A0H76_2928 [Hepatospora eriocheir]
MTPTVKYSKGCIIMRIFSYRELEKVKILKRNMTAMYYIRIINKKLFKSMYEYDIVDSYIFQQDNYPRYKATFTAELFDKYNLEVLN